MEQNMSSQKPPRQQTNLKKTFSNVTGSAQTDSALQINDTFTKIHDTIENLDTKVKELVEKHEIEFLFAWQNHIKKIKKELKEIKDRSDEKQKLMNSNERVIAMEKQMTLFRDESLKLYQEVENKKNEIDVLKRRLKEQDLELEILREQNKQLVKNSKIAQAKFVIQHQKLYQILKQLQKDKQPIEDLQRSTFQLFKVQDLTSKKSGVMHSKTLGFDHFNLRAVKSRQHTGVNFEKKKMITAKDTQGYEGHPLSKFKQQKLNRLSVTNKWQTHGFDFKKGPQDLQQQINDIRKKVSLPSNTKQITKHHNFMMIEPKIYDNQLKNWFLECIKSIKKEISSRKSGFTSPAVDVMKVTSLQEFKTIDRLRLLEMFLENQKLLVYMYQKVFPDRLKEIEAFLNQKDQARYDMLMENKANRTISHQNGAFGGKRQDDLKNESIEIQLLQGQTEVQSRNDSKIRVKSVSKASKSQPIRNRIIMRDGKLNLIF